MVRQIPAVKSRTVIVPIQKDKRCSSFVTPLNLDQVSLKDRASFLEDQKALHAAWKADMQALIEGQNGALQQVT